MESVEKGCVYFFKHIGLSPIKIGYSERESPTERFKQFKTYAPFGAEMLGFIRTEKAKILETELHKKYSRDRINGEWFEITKEEAEKCIVFYSNIEDIEEMNRFQLSWSNEVNRIFEIKKNPIHIFFNQFTINNKVYNKDITKMFNDCFNTEKTTRTVMKEFINNNVNFDKGKDRNGRFIIIKQ